MVRRMPRAANARERGHVDASALVTFLSTPHHLGLLDAVEAELAALVLRESKALMRVSRALHDDLLDAHVTRGRDAVRVAVRDAERLLLEPGALHRGAHGLRDRRRRDADERELRAGGPRSSRWAEVESAARTLSSARWRVSSKGRRRVSTAKLPSATSSAASRAVKFTGGSE